MSKLKTWFSSHKLSLNFNKTKITLFGNSRINTQVKIQIDGVNIRRVKGNKFLGVTIDKTLSWKSHIKHIQSKVSRSIVVSKVSRSIVVYNKAKQVLDHKSLHILYCSLISPYLIYYAEDWGNDYKTTSCSLFILQKKKNNKKTIWTVYNAGCWDHTNLFCLW